MKKLLTMFILVVVMFGSDKVDVMSKNKFVESDNKQKEIYFPIDNKVIENMIICDVYKCVQHYNIDPFAYGSWYIGQMNEDVYLRYKNDEFELSNIIEQYAKNFIKKGEYACYVTLNNGYYVKFTGNFEKYDFRKHYFPIHKPRNLEFRLNRPIFMRSTPKLKFLNMDKIEWFLKMDKEEAKKFLQNSYKGTNIYGEKRYDRSIEVKLYFHIKKSKSTNCKRYLGHADLTRGNRGSLISREIFYGLIDKVEFIKNGKVIKTQIIRNSKK